jgi:glutaredoxin
MPSPRRVRLLILATIGTFIFILFYTSGFDSHHDAETYTGQEFIKKTQNAMSANEPPAPIVDFATGEKAGQPHADKDGDGDIDADDQKLAAQMQERLKAAEAEAKGKANEKGGLRPDPPKKVVGVGSSAEGQDKDKIVKPVGGESGDVPAPAAAEKKPETETRSKEAIAAREELDSILKKSPGRSRRATTRRTNITNCYPVIIFSKTYCPFSKRAKSLLIEKYSITPEPYVVELDIHPQGQALQDQLLETTGRRTVPNIMVNGVSLGGADDIAEMDQAGKLVGKIVDLGNKRVEVLERTK